MLAPSTNQTETHVKMRHLQPKQTPSANFWAVSQGESARNATQRRRFPRSEKLTANNSRQKPHRSPGPMAKSAPFSCETAQNPRGRDHGRSLGSRKRRCGRASDIAGSCPQARAQQPPAPTANGAPAATWTHPCSKSSHIGGQLSLRISMTNAPTTAIRLLGHCYQAFNQGRKKGRSTCQERSACRRRIIRHAPAEPFQ